MFKFNKEDKVVFNSKVARLEAPSGYYFSDGIAVFHESLVADKHKKDGTFTLPVEGLVAYSTMAILEKKHQEKPFSEGGLMHGKDYVDLQFINGKLSKENTTIGVYCGYCDGSEKQFRPIRLNIYEEITGRGFNFNFNADEVSPIIIFEDNVIKGAIMPCMKNEDFQKLTVKPYV